MIRWLAPALLAALPASAQDFRGLRPGMPASALGAIGEPQEVYATDEGTQAFYPLPFGHVLMVDYTDAGVLTSLATYAGPDASDAPQSGGLRAGETTLAAAIRVIGENRDHLETPGLVFVEPLSERRFSLVYEIEDLPGVALILDFSAEPTTDRMVAAERRGQELSDAVFVAASLVEEDALRDLRHPDGFPGGPRTAPIPFPISLDEAFPSLIP